MEQTKEQIKVGIRDFIAQNLLFSTEGFQHADSASLLGEGIIDSIGVMELVTFVTSEHGINVAPEELVPANFDSVDRLADFVARKKQLAAAA
jgi:acyl carrier protein